MTTLREAAQQALEALVHAEDCVVLGEGGHLTVLNIYAPEHISEAITALRAALAEYDKDRVKVEEMKANWALQRKLADETYERDKQQREYEKQRLAALAEPVQEPDLSRCPQCGGPADNGHDRSIPPNPYFCTRCMAYVSLQDQNTELDQKLAEMERKLLELQTAVLQSQGIRD